MINLAKYYLTTHEYINDAEVLLNKKDAEIINGGCYISDYESDMPRLDLSINEKLDLMAYSIDENHSKFLDYDDTIVIDWDDL